VCERLDQVAERRDFAVRLEAKREVGFEFGEFRVFREGGRTQGALGYGGINSLPRKMEIAK